MPENPYSPPSVSGIVELPQQSEVTKRLRLMSAVRNVELHGVMFGAFGALILLIGGFYVFTRLHGMTALIAVSGAALLGIAHLVTGVGFVKLTQWSRGLALLTVLVDLPLFPFGTIFGIYTLFILFSEKTAPVFVRENQALIKKLLSLRAIPWWRPCLLPSLIGLIVLTICAIMML